MVHGFALLLVAAGVLLALWWAVTNRPQIASGFAASLIAVTAGVALLVRGQIAELSAARADELEHTAARVSADVQAVDRLLAKVEAGRAAIDRAAASAAESKRLVAEVRAELADAERRLAGLNARIEQSHESFRTVESTPAAAQPRPESLAQPVPARDLSADQAELLASSLRASGTHELTLTTPRNDSEAIEFAGRLKTAIEAGGWTVHGVEQAVLPTPVFGLQVLAPVPFPAHATTLLGALGRAGLQPRGLSRQRVEKLEVLVGSNPGPS